MSEFIEIMMWKPFEVLFHYHETDEYKIEEVVLTEEIRKEWNGLCYSLKCISNMEHIRWIPTCSTKMPTNSRMMTNCGEYWFFTSLSSIYRYLFDTQLYSLLNSEEHLLEIIDREYDEDDGEYDEDDYEDEEYYEERIEDIEKKLKLYSKMISDLNEEEKGVQNRGYC